MTWVHEKLDLPETFSRTGNPGPSLPPEKVEFGIGGGAISACIEGSLAFFSLFLVDILSGSEFLPPHSTVYFYANCDKL